MTADDTATLFLDRRRSWGEVYDRVSRLAGAMQATGIQRGDRVALLALNSDRYLECYYAAWWMGAVIVPLNTRWNVKENIYALKDCDPKALLVDSHFLTFLQDIRDAVRSIDTVIHTGEEDTPANTLDYESIIDVPFKMIEMEE